MRTSALLTVPDRLWSSPSRQFNLQQISPRALKMDKNRKKLSFREEQKICFFGRLFYAMACAENTDWTSH